MRRENDDRVVIAGSFSGVQSRAWAWYNANRLGAPADGWQGCAGVLEGFPGSASTPAGLSSRKTLAVAAAGVSSSLLRVLSFSAKQNAFSPPTTRRLSDHYP